MQLKKKNKSLMKQFRCPKGNQGRIVAASMNCNHSSLTNWGLKEVEINPQFNILDVGCGGGRTVNKLARLSFQGKVFGIDHSPDMVDYSKEVNSDLISQNRVSIIEGSIEKTDFPENYFDLVTAIETYYFWSNLLNAFIEINRILKPKGKLLLINEMIKDGVYEVENEKIIAETSVHLVPLTEIEIMLKSIGFIKIKILTKKDSAWNIVIAQKQ